MTRKAGTEQEEGNRGSVVPASNPGGERNVIQTRETDVRTHAVAMNTGIGASDLSSLASRDSRKGD